MNCLAAGAPRIIVNIINQNVSATESVIEIEFFINLLIRYCMGNCKIANTTTKKSVCLISVDSSPPTKVLGANIA